MNLNSVGKRYVLKHQTIGILWPYILGRLENYTGLQLLLCSLINKAINGLVLQFNTFILHTFYLKVACFFLSISRSPKAISLCGVLIGRLREQTH